MNCWACLITVRCSDWIKQVWRLIEAATEGYGDEVVLFLWLCCILKSFFHKRYTRCLLQCPDCSDSEWREHGWAGSQHKTKHFWIKMLKLLYKKIPNQHMGPLWPSLTLCLLVVVSQVRRVRSPACVKHSSDGCWRKELWNLCLIVI